MNSFSSLDDYVALPRVEKLAMSPAGDRLAAVVQQLGKDGYQKSLWEIDPEGVKPATRLTFSAKGESAPCFTHDGQLLFISARPNPDDPDAEAPAVWLMPKSGEARVIASRPGGISAVKAATQAPVLAFMAQVMPHATDAEDDARFRKLRKEAKVAAIEHHGMPVRFWDTDLGPDYPQLFTASLDSSEIELRPLTPDAGPALTEASWEVSPDGSTIVASWRLLAAGGEVHETLVSIDVATGARRTLVDDPDADVHAPVFSPDGKQVSYIRTTIGTPDSAEQVQLWLLDLATGSRRRLAAEWDRWPSEVAWAGDGKGVYIVADEDGRAPVFYLGLDAEAPVKLTEDGAFFNLLIADKVGYAMATSYAYPLEPVRINLDQPAVTTLPAFDRPELPGTLTEVRSTASDGTPLRGWLVLPEGASAAKPAPLLLWVHGGPLGSWNAWSWRWNPWLMAAQGYAVLLPDPALSTGYGQDFIQRGWGTWGDAPYTDLMAITDAVIAREDIDETRTGAMGGSFGGYMANWIAGHTDRFKAIVTHASLWALDQFGPTTDLPAYWRRQISPENAEIHSPHRYVKDIVTPMLVVHGDRDYRVPIGEGLRLWNQLLADSGLPADENGETKHRFLYFPDENHWVLKPQHAKVWYQVVYRFLAKYVLELPDSELPPRPEELG